MISDIIIGNIDIMLFSETKIDESFPSSQFFISGFSPPFRSDRSIYGGGLLLYVRKDIPAKLLSCSYCSKIECLPIEVNLHNKKWLIYGIYDPKRADIVTHLSLMRNSIDHYSTSYDNIVVLGDFNSEPSDDPLDPSEENLDLFTKKVNIDFNASITLGVFPNNLKYADISPVF